jgi:hypothetical protein
LLEKEDLTDEKVDLIYSDTDLFEGSVYAVYGKITDA